MYNSEDTEVDNLIKEKYAAIFNGSIPNIGEKYRKLLDLLVGKNKIDVKDVGNDIDTYVEKHIQTQWDQAKTYYENINNQIFEQKKSMEFEKTKNTLFTETKKPLMNKFVNMDSLKILNQEADIIVIVDYINTYNIMLSKFVAKKKDDIKIYKFLRLSKDYKSLQGSVYTNKESIEGEDLPDNPAEIIKKLSTYLDLREIGFPIILESKYSIAKIKDIKKKENIPKPELVIEIPQVDNNATKEMNDKISSDDNAIEEMNKKIESLQPIDLSEDINNQLVNNVFTSTYKELFEDVPEEYKIEEFVAFVRDMEYNRLQKEKVGDVVCTNRRVEGEYINDSLRELRDEIKHIMTIKNKDALSVMPNYIDICFDQYCPDHKDCFGFDSQITKDDTLSEASASNASIMGAVRKFLTDSGYGTDEKINKDILISIFCVFNISRMANNPPLVPYVDINKLKRLYYYGDIFGKDVNEFVEEGNELIHTLQEEYKDTYKDEGATEQKQKDLDDDYEKRMDEVVLSVVIDEIMTTLGLTYQTMKATYLNELFGEKETGNLRDSLSLFFNGKAYDQDYYDKVRKELNKRKDEMKQLLQANREGRGVLTPIVEEYTNKNTKPKAETVYKTTNKLQNILDNKETIDKQINIEDLNNKETMIETFDGILGILSYRNVMAKTGESAINEEFTGGADDEFNQFKGKFIACLEYLKFKRELFLELNNDTNYNKEKVKEKFATLKNSDNVVLKMPAEVETMITKKLGIPYNYIEHIKPNLDFSWNDSNQAFLYIRGTRLKGPSKFNLDFRFKLIINDLIKDLKYIFNTDNTDNKFVQYVKEIAEKPEDSNKSSENLHKINFHSNIYTDSIPDINNKIAETNIEIAYLTKVIAELRPTENNPHIDLGLITTVSKNVKKNNEIKTKNAEQLLLSKEITKEYIKKVLDFVDNNNAISAIGTLEFLDKMAKLDSVGLTTCNYDELGDDKRILTDDYEYKKQWKDDYEKDFKFSPLYQEIKVNGGKKTSKSLKQKKKRVNQTKKREKH